MGSLLYGEKCGRAWIPPFCLCLAEGPSGEWPRGGRWAQESPGEDARFLAWQLLQSWGPGCPVSLSCQLLEAQESAHPAGRVVSNRP